MPRTRSPALTDGELRIMRVLWDRGSATVGEVVEHIVGPAVPAYNTVLTMLRILERKGHVTRRKDGRAHVYVPRLERADARRSALKSVLKRFFDGSPGLLVLNLLEDDQLDAEELQRVRELMDREASSAGREPGRVRGARAR